MADPEKMVVEFVKNEAPLKEPTFEWWVCWRDKPDSQDFKCLTVDTMELALREVDRLAVEVAGRYIWVSALAGAYKSKITVEVLPQVNSMQIARRCVN